MSDSEGQGALRGLKYRFGDLLDFVGRANERTTKECSGYMLLKFGLTPKTCEKYLRWAEEYGLIEYCNPARNRLRRKE